MKTNLYISFYKDKNPERQKELETCLELNLKAGFDKIYLFVENKESMESALTVKHNMRDLQEVMMFVPVDSRPAFQQYIDLHNQLNEPDSIACVCNSDIYITPTHLDKIRNLPWDRKLFVALSRWDIGKEGVPALLDRWDSADFWSFYGKCEVMDANCPLGVPGIDNSLAWKFKEIGYHVVNPSRDIITNHLHNVTVYNYREDAKADGAIIADLICKEPYHFHTPIFINEI